MSLVSASSVPYRPRHALKSSSFVRVISRIFAEAALLLLALFLLAGVVSPVLTSSTRDARTFDAEHQMLSLRSRVLVALERDKRLPTNFDNLLDPDRSSDDRKLQEGSYFTIENRVYDLGGGRAALVARPGYHSDGWGVYVFECRRGTDLGAFMWDDLHNEVQVRRYLASQMQRQPP